MECGTLIAQARKKKGLTQAQLSALCQIPQGNLSNIEQGKKDLTVSMLIRLARALTVHPGALIEQPPAIRNNSLSMTRERVEALANAAVGQRVRLTGFERSLVFHLKNLSPETASKRPSFRRSQESWQELTRILDKKAIKALFEKVRDAKKRQS